MGRQVTEADFVELYTSFATKAVENFNEEGGVEPQTLSLTLGDKPGEVTSMGMLHPKAMQMFYSDGAGKDGLATFIRTLLTPGTVLREILHGQGLPLADVVIQIAEAWMKDEMKSEEHEADKAKYGPSLETHPGRREVILVCVHALNESKMGFCPVTDNPRRAEFKPLWSEGRVLGRFAMGDNGEEE